MTLNEYQSLALETAQYPDRGNNALYPALGLAGETGEAVDKVKKIWRNFGITDGHQYTEAQKWELAKEIGDVMWYVSALSYEIGYDLEDVAETNIAKLRDRQTRGVIKSEGDNR
jgi:NTP pyrophosphatase (non-canonical NTP hydrolase)